MLRNYIKIAWKVLQRNRFFTFVSLFGISLTIGILLVLATLFDLIAGKHYPEDPSKHVVMVSRVHLDDGKGSNYTGNPGLSLIENYIKKLKSPKRIALFTSGLVTNSFVGNKKLTLKMARTCDQFWKINKFQFLEGKPFDRTHIDEKAKVVILSRATRDDYFGEGDESVVGKYFETDNTKFRVMGVVENVAKSQIYYAGDIFIPYTVERYASRSTSFIGGYYALLEGNSSSDIDKIKEEYLSLVSKIDADLKNNPWDGKYINISSHAISKFEELTYLFSSGNRGPEFGRGVLAIVIPMILFMMLPALNLVNLNSSRIMERSSEIGVRKAFGATSRTLAVQFVIENILITFIGGVIGLAIALIGLEIIEASGLIKYAQLGLRLNVFFLAIILCLFFGILSGTLPAWRMSKIQVVNALKGIQS